MVSRGEVGLIVTAMGAASGVFRESEVAVMVSVVLFTTLLTPLALRGAFRIKCPEDDEDEALAVYESLLQAPANGSNHSGLGQ
jgi:Kef-type K+ transport system membrane component KefB